MCLYSLVSGPFAYSPPVQADGSRMCLLCVQLCADASLRAEEDDRVQQGKVQRKIIEVVGTFVGFLHLRDGPESKNTHFPSFSYKKIV